MILWVGYGHHDFLQYDGLGGGLVLAPRVELLDKSGAWYVASRLAGCQTSEQEKGACIGSVPLH